MRGTGLREAREPDEPIDVGNAGTLLRLLPGWLAAQEGRSFTLDGDESIRRRPVDRIAEPLRQMGAQLEARDGRFPPLQIHGTRLHAISYELEVASAQVKSCLLLAGLAADGATTVGEPSRSRDHTERMLLRAGVAIHRNGRHVTVVNADELLLDRVVVPGDPSSAAFMVAAGVLVPGSRLLISDVGVNWTRTGFLRIVRRMKGIVLGDLEDEIGELVPRGARQRPRRRPRCAGGRPSSSPTRCRSRSTSCRSSLCSAASPRARPSCAAPRSCASRRPTASRASSTGSAASAPTSRPPPTASSSAAAAGCAAGRSTPAAIIASR